jgi:hypothetical protein
MIKRYFRYIVNLTEVEIVAIFGNLGNPIESWNKSYLNTSTLNEVGKNYLQIFGLKSHLNSDEEEIAVEFEKGIIYVRNFRAYFLFIYGKPQASVPHLRLAANVGNTMFEQSKDFKKVFKNSPYDKILNVDERSLDDVERFIFQSILKE